MSNICYLYFGSIGLNIIIVRKIGDDLYGLNMLIEWFYMRWVKWLFLVGVYFLV